MVIFWWCWFYLYHIILSFLKCSVHSKPVLNKVSPSASQTLLHMWQGWVWEMRWMSHLLSGRTVFCLQICHKLSGAEKILHMFQCSIRACLESRLRCGSLSVFDWSKECIFCCLPSEKWKCGAGETQWRCIRDATDCASGGREGAFSSSWLTLP